jgi:hypothetical protein
MPDQPTEFGCIRTGTADVLAGAAATGRSPVLGVLHAARPPARTAATTMPKILDVLLN